MYTYINSSSKPSSSGKRGEGEEARVVVVVVEVDNGEYEECREVPASHTQGYRIDTIYCLAHSSNTAMKDSQMCQYYFNQCYINKEWLV